jgi:hypothetical protein
MISKPVNLPKDRIRFNSMLKKSGKEGQPSEPEF